MELEASSLLLDFVGKDAKFLVKMKEQDSHELAFLNESIVEMLVTCRGKYLLAAAAAMMEIPGAEGDLIAFEDISQQQAKWLHSLLQDLSSNATPATSEQRLPYVMEVEARMLLQTCGEQTGSSDSSAEDTQALASWSGLWTSIIQSALTAVSRLDKEEAQKKFEESGSAFLMKLLPKPSSVCPKFFLDADGPAGKDSVKAEPGQQPKDGQSGVLEIANPTFSSLYSMHDLGQKVKLNVLDVVHLRATIEAHLLAVASTASSKTLLDIMRIDSKHSALISTEDLVSGLAGQKLYAYGAVTTEGGSKSLKVPCQRLSETVFLLLIIGGSYQRLLSRTISKTATF